MKFAPPPWFPPPHAETQTGRNLMTRGWFQHSVALRSLRVYAWKQGRGWPVSYVRLSPTQSRQISHAPRLLIPVFAIHTSPAGRPHLKHDSARLVAQSLSATWRFPVSRAR